MANVINGDSNNNALPGTGGDDSISGLAGDDFIDGQDGADTLLGGDGNDYLQGGAGNDTIDGGAGYNTARYPVGLAGPANFTAGENLAVFDDGQGGIDTLTNIQQIDIYGGGFNDVLVGNSLRNWISGGGGDDTITGGGGNDTFVYDLTQPNGGTITDLAPGEDLRFYVPGIFDQFAITSVIAGDNPAVPLAGEVMVGTPSGGTTMVYVGTDGSAGAEVAITLQGSYAAGDFHIYNDQYGSSLRYEPGQVINGTPGNDNLQGGGGDDTISGAGGDDNLQGGAGNDTIDGGAGYNTAAYPLGQAGPVNFIAGENLAAFDDGQGGTDTLTNIQEIHIYGGGFNDILVGNSLRSWISGNAGDDTLTGGGGNDTFGYDITQPNGNDTVTDLALGEDLRFYVPGTVDQFALTSVIAGDSPLGLLAGQVMVGTPSGGTTQVYVGTDGSAGADITVTLQGSYAAGDFHIYDDQYGSSLRYEPGQVINGTPGNDYLQGGGGNDTISGAGGDDNLQGGAGNDTIDGGAGYNTVSYPVGQAGPANFTAGENLAAFSDGQGGTDTLTNIQEIQIYGGGFNDVLVGNSLRNWISGNAGDDTITGGAGKDTFAYDITQAAGNDTITDLELGENLRFMPGTASQFALTSLVAGDDPSGLLAGQVMVGTPSGGTTHVYVGTDGSAGADITVTLQGSYAAGDFYFYNDQYGSSLRYEPAQVIDGTPGDDNLLGGGGNDTMTGEDGNDFINGRAGADSILGGAGSDGVVGGAGNDTLDGGAILDRVNYNDLNTLRFDSAVAGVNVNLQTGIVADDGEGGSDQVSNFNFVRGTSFNDFIVGNSSDTNLFEQFEGRAGDDTIDGGTISPFSANRVSYQNASGAVQVNLGTGTATGADGNDTLININYARGSGFADTLTGSDTTAHTETFEGRAGDDTIDGQGGTDQIRFDSPAGVVVNLATGVAQDGFGTIDTFVNIENVRGTDFGDAITGDSGHNVLDARGGDDTVDGGSGNDNISGRDGNDSMLGGEGADTINGGGGDDSMDGGAITDRVNYTDYNVASYFDSAAAVNIDLQTGIAQDGWGGTDTLNNINIVTSSAFDDTITGSSALIFEQFDGGLGNDTIDGGAIDALDLAPNRVNYFAGTGAVTVDLGAGTASGAMGNDTLININYVRGTAFGDVVTGSNATAYTEQLEGRGGDDTIDGMGGVDIVRYENAAIGVNVNLATGIAQDGEGGTDTLLNIEGVRGSAFDDVLTGGDPVNDSLEVFIGAGGDDTIDGGTGRDRADYSTSTTGAVVTLGGPGVDGAAQDGLGGTDTLRNIEGVRGSEFDDTLTGSDTAPYEWFEGRGGSDLIDGKGGEDLADYKFSTSDVKVDLSAGTALDCSGATDTLLNIEDVRGSIFADAIKGDGGANVLEGLAGDDTLDGGEGQDTAVFTGNFAEYVISTGDVFGELIVTGPEGADLLRSIEILQFADFTFLYKAGTSASETITALPDEGSIIIDAGAGDDVLVANDTGNALLGGEGDDSLVGAAGADLLNGGTEADTMAGGDGDDVYIVDSAGDEVIETDGPGLQALDAGLIFAALSLGRGIDKVVASINYQLGSFVENLTLTGTALAGTGNELENVLAGNAESNTLSGQAGNDTLQGGEGDDSIDGGAGTDTVNFTGTRAEYHLAISGSTLSAADQIAGRDGTDSLAGVETLVFADCTVDLTMGQKAEAISPSDLKTLQELYVGFFNRVPEAEGLAYWIGEIQSGVTLNAVADQFYSAGVQFGVYSESMTEPQFITAIYANVLGRTGDSAPNNDEIGYWQEWLHTGTNSKGAMVLQMLSDCHTWFVGDPVVGWVVDLLDNKAEVADYFAIELGMTYNDPQTNISRGIEIAAAITPDDITAAVELIGVS